MKLLIDAQLPPALARALVQAGFATRHAGSLGLLEAGETLIELR